MNLSGAKSGVSAVIVGVDLQGELRSYAESRGLFVGNILRIVRCYKSRFLVEIDQSVFLLPPQLADKIEVKLQ